MTHMPPNQTRSFLREEYLWPAASLELDNVGLEFPGRYFFMQIAIIDPEQALALIHELDVYQAVLYPAESNHLDSLETLRQPNVVFLGALEGEAVLAIGAVKIFADYGEIKRLYVPEAQRGKGLARQIMAELEGILIERGVMTAKLETGIYQEAALGLYRTLGYQMTGPFGLYQPDPLSVFMSKQLPG
jgi:putative acetyltransferase